MRQSGTIKAILDTEVVKERFSMATILQAVANVTLEDTEALHRFLEIGEALGDRVANHVLQGVIRATFLIELVKQPKIETTKFEVRWADRLGEADPRYASYVECLEIFERVMTELESAVEDQENRHLVQLFYRHNLIPYEIPLDYVERKTIDYIHRAHNIAWFFDELPRRVIRLRTLLLDKTGDFYSAIFIDAYEKIRVKTYLTDRVLTGAHKTNREKRWETHPASVHFALRRTCLDIEYALINQLCHFEGFPTDLRLMLETEGMLLPIEPDPTRCPITLEPLVFDDFEEEVRNPKHGKSNFQVGHLNPLKAINDDPQSGHTGQNISWVSSDGNRIQGHLSLLETRALIRRINANYARFGRE